MKTVVKISVIILSVITIGLTSCKDKNKNVPTPDEKTMEDLNIPSDFDYATTTKINLHISDVENGAKYDIYSMKSESPEKIIYTDDDTLVIMDDMNKKVASGMTVNNAFDIEMAIPSYHKYLYIVRSKDGYFVRETIPVDGNDITYSYNGYHNQGGYKSGYGRGVAGDILYAVNGHNKNMYTIDLSTGDVNLEAVLPYKSNANAVDKANGRVYVANKKTPFELGYYDISSGNFEVVGNLVSSFPRMDYNPADGLLYISDMSHLNTIDPSNAHYLQTYNIVGLDNKSWGDLAFAEDGTLYILTKIGVYRCEISGNTVFATLISDNTLPNSLTSLSVGSNDHLYMSRSKSNGKIIDFDPSDGSWTYFNISDNIRINDFGIVRATNAGGNDSDGDGVIDIQDDYPNDPERAFNNYFPGENTWASLAFEDLWPAKGDYDFNDMVLGYNINQVTSASNKVVDIISKFKVRHNGAGLHNAFAFQVPVDQSYVGSVTSTYSYNGQIQLNGNGTIAGQNLANILVFEDNWDVTGTEIDITVNFSTPQSVSSTGVPPYNPYLIKDGDQSVEVHLPDMEPTAMADVSLFGTDDDTSDPASGRYYKSNKNLPWAINIVYDFKWMKEKQEIINGYLHFADWAESGGTQYPDWYKDLPGYRDESFLDSDGN
jgi:LruC domain-containing protein